MRDMMDLYPATVRGDQDYFTGALIEEQEATPLSVDEAAAGVAFPGDRKLPKKTAKVTRPVTTDSDISVHPVNQGIQRLLGKGLAKKKASKEVPRKVSRIFLQTCWLFRVHVAAVSFTF